MTAETNRRAPSRYRPGMTAALLEGMLAVPGREHRPGPGKRRYGVCQLCRGPARTGHATCWSCRIVLGELGGFEVPVAPLFMFAPGTAAHAVLVGYKAAPSAAGRAWRSEVLASLLATHLAGHLGCLCGRRSPWTGPVGIVPVPSTVGGRASWGGEHPLVPLSRVAVRRAAVGIEPVSCATPEIRVLDVLRAAAAPPRHLEARPDGFVVLPSSELKLRRLLVLDDVYTSGSRIMSAAAALSAAGASVAAVMPIGRLLRPDHNGAAAAFFADASRRSWSARRCALCPPAPARVLAAGDRAGRVVARLALAA